MGMVFSCRTDAFFPGAHKIGAAISGPRIADKSFTDTRIVLNLHRANGRGCFGGQTAGGHPKAFPWPKKPLFAVPALRELESACRVSIL